MILVSDLHFGALSQAAIDQVTAACIKDGFAVISGDITLKSTPKQFAAARAFIKNLRDNNVVVVLTAGNHDFGGSVAELASRVVVVRSIHTGKQTMTINVIYMFYAGYHKARAELLSIYSQQIFVQNSVLAHETESYDTIVKDPNSLNVFVALRSQHRKGPRIRDCQIAWAIKQLSSLEGIDKCKLHLVAHHSLWQDSSDKHEPMTNLKPLEEKLLKPFKFSTYIHGHNHRFSFQHTHTPSINYPIVRISVPTVCDRNREFSKAFLTWDGNSKTLPTCVDIDPNSPEPKRKADVGDEQSSVSLADAQIDKEKLDLGTSSSSDV